MIRDYFGAMFEPTLLFGLCASLIGLSAALYYSHLNLQLAILVVIGVIFAQMAVNMVDDYTDYRKGIDSETVKTKFSGGSNVLTDGKMKPKELLGLGVATALVAGVIGAFLLGSAPAILPIILIGGISIFFYAAFLVRIPFLAEPLTSLNFTLIPLGSYIVAHGVAANINSVLFAMVPAGMMVGIALIANSIPDKIPDKKHGRRNGAVMLDRSGRIAAYYLAWWLLAWTLVISGILINALPVTFVITLLTVPFALRVYNGIRSYKDPASHEKFMGLNALATIGFIFLCSVSYVLAVIT